jgi:membrane protease YdiL (CAAX protease family)
VSENPPEQEERILQRGADETGSFLPGNWGWEILVVVGFSYWVAMALGVQTLMWGLGLEPVEGAPPVDGRLLFGSAFAQIFGALVTVKIAQLMDPERWRQRLGIGRKPLVDFARGLVWYVPIGLTVWLGIYVYTAIYQHWIHADGLEQQYVAQLASDPELGPLLVLLAFANVAGLAALGEELVFRGLLHGWLRRYLSFWPAAFMGAGFLA